MNTYFFDERKKTDVHFSTLRAATVRWFFKHIKNRRHKSVDRPIIQHTLIQIDSPCQLFKIFMQNATDLEALFSRSPHLLKFPLSDALLYVKRNGPGDLFLPPLLFIFKLSLGPISLMKESKLGTNINEEIKSDLPLTDEFFSLLKQWRVDE